MLIVSLETNLYSKSDPFFVKQFVPEIVVPAVTSKPMVFWTMWSIGNQYWQNYGPYLERKFVVGISYKLGAIKNIRSFLPLERTTQLLICDACIVGFRYFSNITEDATADHALFADKQWGEDDRFPIEAHPISWIANWLANIISSQDIHLHFMWICLQSLKNWVQEWYMLALHLGEVYQNLVVSFIPTCVLIRKCTNTQRSFTINKMLFVLSLLSTNHMSYLSQPTAYWLLLLSILSN